MISSAVVLVLIQAASGAPRLPVFSDYAVVEIFSGKPAAVDFRSYPGARRFRTRLTESAAKGSNFAGRFTVVTWGCGTACQENAIVDAKSGRVYFPLPKPTSNGICFRLDSALLITDPIDRETLEGFEGKLPDWLQTRYWRWDGAKMIQIASTRDVIGQPCDAEPR